METVNAVNEQKNKKYRKPKKVEEENYIDSDSDDDEMDYSLQFGKQPSLKKNKSLKAKLSKAELKQRFTYIFTDILTEEYT